MADLPSVIRAANTLVRALGAAPIVVVLVLALFGFGMSAANGKVPTARHSTRSPSRIGCRPDVDKIRLGPRRSAHPVAPTRRLVAIIPVLAVVA